MIEKNISVILTRHAEEKIAERNISLELIKNVVLSPDKQITDMHDKELIHFIGVKHNKSLRIIGRWEKKNVFLVISAFYDRRLKRK